MTLAVGSIVAIVTDESGETLQTGAQSHVFRVAELATHFGPPGSKPGHWAILEVIK